MAIVATGERRPSVSPHRYLDELVEGQAETFECQVRARDGRDFWIVGNVVATGRDGSAPPAHLRAARHRAPAPGRGRGVGGAGVAAPRDRGGAAGDLAARRAHARRWCRSTSVAARDDAQVGAEPCSARCPRRSFRAEIAAARRQRHGARARLERGDDARVPLRRRRRRERLGRALSAARRRTGRAARPAARSSPPTSPSSARPRRRASRPRSRSARCWSRKSTTGSRTTCRASPACCSRSRSRKPEVAAAIDEVVGQVQAIAQVYGLQVGDRRAAADASACSRRSPARCSARSAALIRCRSPTQRDEWTLPEVEAIPIALTINELLTNAIKHSAPAQRRRGTSTVPSTAASAGVRVAISNRARLPCGFNLARIPNGVSGLGLVRALLPRRQRSLRIEQADDRGRRHRRPAGAGRGRRPVAHKIGARHDSGRSMHRCRRGRAWRTRERSWSSTTTGSSWRRSPTA